MTTSAELKQMTVKDLSAIAREYGVTGWHEMRKEELVRAIVLKARSAAARGARSATSQNRQSTTGKTDKASNVGKIEKTQKVNKTDKQSVLVKPTSSVKKPLEPLSGVRKAVSPLVNSKPAAQATATSKVSPGKTIAASMVPKKTEKPKRTPQQSSAGLNQSTARLKEKLPSQTTPVAKAQDDQLILMVRDPFWLHLFWRLSPKGIERAKAAMGHFWHTAYSVVRLYRLVADGNANPRREFIRDIRVHSGVCHWYIDVYDPPASFQVEVGFVSREGHFYPVASSNIVETPQNQVTDNVDKLDGNWLEVAQDFDRVYKLSGGLSGHNKEMKAVFEEQLHRPMSVPLLSRFGPRAHGNEKTRRNFSFQMEADLVIHGKTDPSVQISIKGEPIRLAADGSFSVRFALAEKRQVFPISAASSDGVETQTVILAVERNTKILETVFLENENED